MNKLGGILLAIFLVVGGCTSMPIKDPVCPQENSWICSQSEKTGVQPETVYGWIYNATAIAAISDIVSITEICDFEKKIADWYVEVYPISYNSVISKVMKEAGLIADPKKALLIQNIINQNLYIYSSDSIISEADGMILKKGHKRFRSDMFCD